MGLGLGYSVLSPSSDWGSLDSARELHGSLSPLVGFIFLVLGMGVDVVVDLGLNCGLWK